MVSTSSRSPSSGVSASVSADLPVVVLLAAGRSRRFRSSRSKAFHVLAGRPVIAWAAAAAESLGPIRRLVVVSAEGLADEAGGKSEAGEGELHAVIPDWEPVAQNSPLGTGDAARVALEACRDLPGRTPIVLMVADAPLLLGATLGRLLEALGAEGVDSAWLGFHPRDPAGYGRFRFGSDGHLESITEWRDLSEAERNEPGPAWSGVMAATLDLLARDLPSLGSDNAQGEFLLPDLARAGSARGGRAASVLCDAEEAQGVNDRVQLARAESVLQERLRFRALESGAGLVAPESVFLSYDTVLEPDCRVEPWVWFGCGVTVGSGAVVRSFSHIEGARIGPDVTVGPFARLRPGTVLERGARVGNFVEIKASHLGEGVKAGHLSYVGDSLVGARSNLGAGTITCNYDGFAKHETRLGAEVFIGSHTSLVAPVSIGDRAFVGAGSVVTKDAPADALVVARARQVTLPDRARARRARGGRRKKKAGAP